MVEFRKCVSNFMISITLFEGLLVIKPLLCLSSYCLVVIVWLFLVVPRVFPQFVIVVFPDHTHLLFRML